MKFLHSLSLGALIATPVYSVTLSEFPLCAQRCIDSIAAEIGGSTNDNNFICKSSAFLSAVDACEAQTCGPSDISRIFTLSIQICEPVRGTNAIGLGNLSSCAQPGLAIATAESGCSTTDWTCICASQAYTIVAAKYEEQYCSPADRQAILVYTSAACAAVGIQLQPPAPNTPSSSSASSPAPTASSQSVYDFPQCAQPCVDAALLQGGCQPSDWDCICVNPAFIGGEAAFCELEFCSVDDQYRILNITNAQCSAIGEALVPATTFPPASSTGGSFSGPLEAATVSLVFPTGNVPGSVPKFLNLPTCAQFCATNATTQNGGSVTDLDFLCKNGEVLVSIGACESALCSPTDQQTSVAISQKICEPVGGVASINPTVNPSAQPSVISAAYATTTVVSGLNYVPSCAKPCLVTAFQESGCALDDLPCQCTNNAFANLFTNCQAAVCGVLDLQKLLPYTVKRCQSVGIAIDPSILSIESDVAYQIPTSIDTLPTPTDLANAPNDLADLPSCAQECIYSAASFASCDIHNLTCVCLSKAFNFYVSTCEIVACTADELQVNNAYAAALCTPVLVEVFGIPSASVFSFYLAEETNSAPSPPTINTTGGVSLFSTANLTFASPTGGSPPKAASFTGNTVTVRMRVLDYVLGAVMWLFWTA